MGYLITGLLIFFSIGIFSYIIAVILDSFKENEDTVYFGPRDEDY